MIFVLGMVSSETSLKRENMTILKKNRRGIRLANNL